MLKQMSAVEYHSDPVPGGSLSASIAHTLVSKSPLHAWLTHPRLGGQRSAPTRRMDRGSLVHSILLDGGRELVVIDAADWRTKAAKEERATANQDGKLAVLQKEYDAAQIAASAITAQLDGFGINLSEGDNEIAVFWEEPADDGEIVMCRGMLDHLATDRRLIVDLKTCASANPIDIGRHMVQFGCEIQAAAYTSGIGKTFPELAGRIEFLFLFAEVEPPYCVTPVHCAGSMVALGEARWRRAVNRWAECMRSDVWPGYVDHPVSIEAPHWLMNQEMGEPA